MRNATKRRRGEAIPWALTEAEVLSQLPALQYALAAQEAAPTPRLWRTPLLPSTGEVQG